MRALSPWPARCKNLRLPGIDAVRALPLIHWLLYPLHHAAEVEINRTMALHLDYSDVLVNEVSAELVERAIGQVLEVPKEVTQDHT
jgi:hypothetical protein